MSEPQDLGYVVVFVNEAGKIDGFLSAKLKNYRDAHAERRAWLAGIRAADASGHGPKITPAMRARGVKVAIAKGVVR